MNTKIFMKQHVRYYKDVILTDITWYKKFDKLLRKFLCYHSWPRKWDLMWEGNSALICIPYNPCTHSFVALLAQNQILGRIEQRMNISYSNGQEISSLFSFLALWNLLSIEKLVDAYFYQRTTLDLKGISSFSCCLNIFLKLDLFIYKSWLLEVFGYILSIVELNLV